MGNAMENSAKFCGILAFAICVGVLAQAVHKIGNAAEKAANSFVGRSHLVIKMQTPGKWERKYNAHLDVLGYKQNVSNLRMKSMKEEAALIKNMQASVQTSQ